MEPDRLDALETIVKSDPTDLFARLLLGNEYLSRGRTADALPHLTAYCDGFEGDKGAACLSLAKARLDLGDAKGARAALQSGIESARAYRHLQLEAALEAEVVRIGSS